MPEAPTDSEPRPVEPPQPDITACCGQGCNPCIFDLYEMARSDYEVKLRAWEARRAARRPDPGERPAPGRGEG